MLFACFDCMYDRTQYILCTKQYSLLLERDNEGKHGKKCSRNELTACNFVHSATNKIQYALFDKLY